MSSRISYVPIIPPKTKEQIIQEYEMELENIKHDNNRLCLHRKKIIDMLATVHKKIVTIGRKTESIEVKEQEVKKSIVAEQYNNNYEKDEVTIEKVEANSEEWTFERNSEDEIKRIIAKVRSIPLRTVEEAEKANDILKMAETHGSTKEIQLKYKNLIDSMGTVSDEEAKVLTQYTTDMTLLGENAVYSYEEAVENIHSVRHKAEEKLMQEYKMGIFKDACEHVGMDITEMVCNGRLTYAIKGIDDCELEVNEFENGEILLETCGIVRSAEQVSMDKKRQYVESAKKVCTKTEEVLNYIRENYPDVEFKIGNIVVPCEENMKIKYEKGTDYNVNIGTARHLIMEE